RRHTRSKRDWSSDVCSSDLLHGGVAVDERLRNRPGVAEQGGELVVAGGERVREPGEPGERGADALRCVRQRRRQRVEALRQLGEIGRASCRERGWSTGATTR